MEQAETYYFESITCYNKDTYREFAKYHYRHVAPGQPIFLIVAGVMALSWGFIQLFTEPEGWSFWPSLVGIVLLAFGVNQLLGRFGGNVKETVENRMRFFDDRVEYAGQQTQGFYYYGQIERFRENGEYFFLYVAKNRAMMVDKRRMTLGTADQLRGFLYQKITPQVK